MADAENYVTPRTELVMIVYNNYNTFGKGMNPINLLCIGFELYKEKFPSRGSSMPLS